jgi:hypothetical protein
MDAELDRLDREAGAAAAAVREHLAAALLIWRGDVPRGLAPIPITSEWLDEHARLKSERQRAEDVLQDYLSRRSSVPILYMDKSPAAVPDEFTSKTQRPNRAQRRGRQ